VVLPKLILFNELKERKCNNFTIETRISFDRCFNGPQSALRMLQVFPAHAIMSYGYVGRPLRFTSAKEGLVTGCLTPDERAHGTLSIGG